MQACSHRKMKKQEDLNWKPISELISCLFPASVFLSWLPSVLTACRIDILFFFRQIKFREDSSRCTLQLKHCTPSSPSLAKSRWDLCEENSYGHGDCVWSLPGSPTQKGAVGWVGRTPWGPGGHSFSTVSCIGESGRQGH